jgi:hypothetical protein
VRRDEDLIGKTPYVDIMTTMTLLFMILWIVSSSIEKAKTKQLEDANFRTEGVYAISADWPDASGDDVDLYVRDPAGNIVFFSARDLGMMHLEHDDQGKTSDTALTAAGQVTVEKNEERVIIRGIIAGEYVVNLHMYHKRDAAPTPVRVRLVRLKDPQSDVKTVSLTLAHDHEKDQTAFRFTLGVDGTVSDINRLYRPLLPSNGPQGPGGF